MHQIRKSYFEASARTRIKALVDEDSFQEILSPIKRKVSPSLGYFDIPRAFDDGVIIGDATVDGNKVAIIAQEGKFLGGALGEVHSAKIVGMLKRSIKTRPKAMVILGDSGGVRLQEANAGETGASEIIRAVLDTRAAKVPVIGLVGGVCGCYGGMSIISSCFDAIIASEQGRIGVSGPEVIETNMGVDVFDSRDRALVWRTMGCKNRFLFGLVTRLIEDDIRDFKKTLLDLLNASFVYDTDSVLAKRKELARRVEKYGQDRDGLEIWKRMGFENPDEISAMPATELADLKNRFMGEG